MVAGKDKKVSVCPDFGMQLRMPKAFDRIEYYGRGPVENYADRNHCTLIGNYHQTVAEQFYSYIRPQENGTKTDIRWWKLINAGGIGLAIQSRCSLLCLALNYTIESLDNGNEKNQRHSQEVKPTDFTNFCIDKVQMGIRVCEQLGQASAGAVSLTLSGLRVQLHYDADKIIRKHSFQHQKLQNNTTFLNGFLL